MFSGLTIAVIVCNVLRIFTSFFREKF